MDSFVFSVLVKFVERFFLVVIFNILGFIRIILKLRVIKSLLGVSEYLRE